MEAASPPSRLGRIAVVTIVLAGAAFWTWALFFASKEAVNKIDDRAWAARAQAICEQTAAEREALADYSELDIDDPDQLARRAALVDTATDGLTAMLDEIEAVAPADEKGRAIVPDWIADYRRYLEDRREYTETLRGGENVDFLETEANGIPVSERLETFAGDNEMPACAPPRDLVT
ncbi:MAG: hypothetical protein MUE78_09965 [Ilumatobacteraceae bacterium]|nr:hypothetical protein [Ilumatobacteraceae bacterium]